jgi:two-component system, NtrC family, sensor histidine kinase HydH
LRSGQRRGQEQSFGIVKVVSWSSLVLILAISLFLAIFLSNYARETVLDKQRKFAMLLAVNLNHQIYQRFTLPTVIGFGKIELKQKAQYERLEKVILSTVHSFNVQDVRIFDLDKVVAYSTNKNQLGQSGMAGEAVDEALQNDKYTFDLITRVDTWRLLFDFGVEPKSVVLRIVCPLRAERGLEPGEPSGPISGVLEFTQDISADYQNIVNFQRLIIISALATSMALFLILRTIISRADKANAQRIKEREQLERELHLNEKLAGMGRVVAGIAHEIRNPLGIIRSSAELLLKKNKGENGANIKLLTAIFDESKRLSKTVGDFLDYARPKAPKREHVDAAHLLDQALVFLEGKFEEHGIEAVKDYPEKLALTGDKDLIYRAFYNVIVNSIDALAGRKPEDRETPGKIAISASETPEAVVLRFADNGPGFDPEAKDHLLDPFFTTKETGTGLGLAIVNTILQGHDATLALEAGEGGGAVIVMTFPKL